MATVVLLPSVALADVDGTKGIVSSVTINESSADDYASERGSIVVNENLTATRKYQWGGAVCNGKNLSDASIALLFDALRARDKVEIVPSYKAGAGQARCLVGFKLQTIPPDPAR